MDFSTIIMTVSGVLVPIIAIFKLEIKRICKDIDGLKNQVDEIHKKVFHK